MLFLHQLEWFTALEFGLVSGKQDMELALKKGIEDGDVDGDLYYLYVKKQDKLIPYRTMHKREMQNFEAHNHNMIPLFKVNVVEWEYQKELARNAYGRAILWGRKAKKEDEHVFD